MREVMKSVLMWLAARHLLPVRVIQRLFDLLNLRDA